MSPVALLEAAPLLLRASSESESIERLLFVLAVTIVATKVLGALAQRFRQPAVLGELVAGVILGASVLGIFNTHNPALHVLAELGVLILLFQIGLHTDLRSLAKVGTTAITVGGVGVVLPFFGGLVVARALDIDPLSAIVVGAALTATSIGISARVLSDLGQLKSPEGQVVIGAAVFDDVVGLIILSIVASMVGGAELTAGAVSKTAAVAVGFVVLAIGLGSAAIPPLFRVVERIRISGALGSIALAFALLLAWAASVGGSATIIGAFAAGLILHPTPQRAEIERSATQLGFFFVPIFFASVGASVDLATLMSREALGVGAALIAVGVIGKFAAGFAPWWFTGNKALVGVAMIPRGEVGLIFAQLGLTSGVLEGDLFGALMLMVVVTTFVTPPLLERISRRLKSQGRAAPDYSGIDDLVAGSHARREDDRDSASH